jgi:alkanesulfonate monooxygenase SsuD/methylene tetrahydromethanopterin reductase-like flavin-dependent oxidoreductase (luciferase family)
MVGRGGDDAAVDRAARLGDAWVINPHAKLAVLERQMGVYRQALREAGRPFPMELPIIKELYVAPDRRTALKECRPFLEAKYKAYASWGQDKALPEGDSFAHEFEELVADRFIVGDPDDVIREIKRYTELLHLPHPVAGHQAPRRARGTRAPVAPFDQARGARPAAGVLVPSVVAL